MMKRFLNTGGAGFIGSAVIRFLIQEIAYKNTWLRESEMRNAAEKPGSSGYGDYLLSLLKDI